MGQLELSASVFQAWGLGLVDLGRKQKSSKVSESREKGSELQASGYVYIYTYIIGYRFGFGAWAQTGHAVQ